MKRLIVLLPEDIHQPGDMMAVPCAQGVEWEPIDPIHYGEKVGDGSPCVRMIGVILTTPARETLHPSDR